MKILHLPINKKWFDMILSGEKKEEYRDIKTHYKGLDTNNFDAVKFTNGYGHHMPNATFKLVAIKKDTGFVEWGAVDGVVYWVLMLGDFIESNNIKTSTGVKNEK